MRVSRAVVGVSVGILVVGVVGMVAAVRVTGPSPSSRSSLEMIRPAEDVGVVQGTSDALASLTLLSTMVADDPRDSFALLGDLPRKKQAFARLGNRIGSWQVAAIEQDAVLFTTEAGDQRRLVLDRASRDAGLADHPVMRLSVRWRDFQQSLEPPSPEAFEQAAKAITVVSAQERLVDRKQVLAALNGRGEAMFTQGRAIPHFEGMKVKGLRVTWLADSPWAKKIGLQVEDVVTAVNGKSLFDPHATSDIVSDVRRAPSLDVTIQRAGRLMTLHYQMVESASQAQL